MRESLYRGGIVVMRRKTPMFIDDPGRKKPQVRYIALRLTCVPFDLIQHHDKQFFFLKGLDSGLKAVHVGRCGNEQ